jgi:excisionase family DNA binding protein
MMVQDKNPTCFDMKSINEMNTTQHHYGQLWTRKDVSRTYRVSERTVGNWIAERRIPVLKLGRACRFRPDAVAKALEKFEVKAVTK